MSTRPSPIRTEVTFTADHPPDARGTALQLTEHISRCLSDAGFACSEPENIGSVHTFRAVVGNRDFYLLLQPGDDDVRQWLVSTNGGLNPLRRLLGERDHDEHRVLVGVLHEILSAAPGIGDVRWYTVADWEEDRDRKWAATPAGS